MWTGLKMFGGWIKMHPVWAAILFLVVIPFLFLGLFIRVRAFIRGVPGVGSLLNPLADVGDKIAATGLAGKGA